MKELFQAGQSKIAFAISVFGVWFLAGLVFGLPWWVHGSLSTIIAVFLVFWIRKTIAVLGLDDPKCVALKTFLGKPKELNGFGLVSVWWPIEQLWLVPTGSYWWSYETKARTKDNVWLFITVMVSWRYPVDPGDLGKKYHFPKDTWISQKGKVFVNEKAAEIPNGWPKKTSFYLLSKTYNHLPKSPLKTTWQDLSEMFRPAIEGSVIHAVGSLSRVELERHQDWAEAAVKALILQEPGDIPHDIGSPSEVLDIRFTLIQTEEKVKEALHAPVYAEEEVVRAEGRKKAASAYAEADRKRIKVLVDQGVDPHTAAALVSGAEGGKANLDILERMAMIAALQRMSQGEATFMRQRQKRPKGS